MVSAPDPALDARRTGGAAALRPRAAALVLALCCAVLLAVLPAASAAPQAAERPAPGTDDAMGLLRRAAQAAEELPYAGVQSISTTGPSGTEHRMVEVEHVPGSGVRVGEVAAPGGEHPLPPGRSQAFPALAEGMLDALAANYRVTEEAGGGSVAGRPVRLVEARRADGSTAGRFWIDRESGLPLGRESVDGAGRQVHSVEFTSIGEPGADGDEPGGGAPEGAAAAAEDPWGRLLGTDELRGLRERGWSLPERVGWNMRLVEARSARAPTGRVLHLGYSDGLSVVSVFVQEGRLDAESLGTVEGVREVQYRGGTVYVGDSGRQLRMWESDEHVYTVLADAPRDSVAAAAEALPPPEAPGFWGRVRRGFDRFGEWLGM
ncbi:sigma-E factor regulatory protein RseB domain-containing protein [Nocardiopsis halophila]|uniref:sigma-E factor regulatory protein RseB domain-containing protein n=1 Tax=Nocardiopsis halophila TaxID=141692 RepID=UPI00037D99C0|nr:sigma-E factor regulatory protein RseB domain-containing protein [Nocardiopsis halophila]